VSFKKFVRTLNSDFAIVLNKSNYLNPKKNLQTNSFLVILYIMYINIPMNIIGNKLGLPN